MNTYEIKVTSTVVCHGIEANSLQEAIDYCIADLSTRFGAYTETLPETTVVEDLTPP